MAQRRGKKARGGLLIRGSDGSLWFMRDDSAAPVKLAEGLAKSVNSLLEKGAQREITGLSPEIQKLLMDRFDIIDPSGIVVWWSTRLPR